MIDVAIVGAGAMGRLHAATVRRHPGARLARVHDVHDDRAAALAVLHGAAVGPPEPGDWVIIATPARRHAEVLRGVPLHRVLVEKPLAPDAPSARALVRPGMHVAHSERFTHRFWDCSRTVRSIVGFRCTPRSVRGRDVDVVADLLVHDVDRVLCLVGDVDVRGVRGARRGPDGLDAIVADLAWSGGCATLSVDRGAPEPRRSFQVDGRTPPEASPPDALTRQLDSWIASENQENGRWSVAGGAAAVAALEVCDRVRELAG